MHARKSQSQVSYSARGIPSYRVEVWHDGLKKHREIRGGDEDIVLRKAHLQMEEWDTKWAEVSARQSERQSREQQKQQHELQKRLAAERTDEAKRELARLESLLRETLDVDDRVDWDLLKDTSPFPEPKPRPVRAPVAPQPTVPLKEPRRTDPEYTPRLGLLDKLIPSRREARTQEANAKFTADHRVWIDHVASVEQSNRAARERHEARLRSDHDAHLREVAAWEGRREEYLAAQRAANAAIDARRDTYLAGSPDVVLEYCDMVLSASQYPDYFPKEWELDYNAETHALIVDYTLPAPDGLPTLREVKYIQNRGETSESHITESQAAKLYDTALYQIVLRTIHELYEADVVTALQSITFNGWVTSTDRSTGKETTACVLSVQARRDEFLAINLAAVDPKACFKALKGVGSSKLHSMTAVAPIMQIRREDGRFVTAREVANTLDDSVNLAAMDWGDFEHLIREVFEREFSSSGGEVKVTQASRDGGVDAVAFDPDPIRGGKIVIQAKRYTNTVGVSAVRDLYGTVMNEGATKGILVSTSDYGPDAYAFAKDKPLVLLNGSNLLHLLQKHGHSARIDLREAREQALRESSR